MKIIITEYFEKHFNKIVSDLSIEDLITKINIESKNFINLKNPYFKIKIKSKTKTYRLLVLCDSNDLIILFINIFDKKDKIYWENLIWNLHKDKIIEWRDNNWEYIKKWKYYNKII